MCQRIVLICVIALLLTSIPYVIYTTEAYAGLGWATAYDVGYVFLG